MAKSEATHLLEQAMHRTVNKKGVFGCYEVTIGWWGTERVDYMTYDTKGTWRCYEVKASKADFRSKARKTFVGHFNYYVMPQELYEQVKSEIPDHIGVYTNLYSYHTLVCVKKPKKQELGADVEVLKNSMIRSLSRDAEKYWRTKAIKKSK